MTAPEGNDFAKGNPGGDGAPEGNDFAVGNSGGGPPANNQNAKRHGVYSDPFNLFDALDKPEKEWVAQRIYDYLQIAPFGKEDPRAERLAMTVIMAYQEWTARSRITDDGQSERQEITDANGEHVGFVEGEHHLSKEANRLNNAIRLNLQALGFIGPHSELSKPSGDDVTGQTLAEWLSSGVVDADGENMPGVNGEGRTND